MNFQEKLMGALFAMFLLWVFFILFVYLPVGMVFGILRNHVFPKSPFLNKFMHYWGILGEYLFPFADWDKNKKPHT